MTKYVDFLSIALERNVEALERCRLGEGLPDFSNRGSTTRCRNELIVGLVTKEICNHLQMRCVASTARIRYGMKGNFLHPIVTIPHKLTPFFLDPDRYVGFAFDAKTLTGSAGPAVQQLQYCTFNILDLEKLEICEGFAKRIVDFVKYMSDAQILTMEDAALLRERGLCVVFGGVKPNSEFFPKRPDTGEFHYFFALYLVPEIQGKAGRSVKRPKAKSSLYRGIEQNLVETVKAMFRGLEASKSADMEEFERDGLKLVSELVRSLTNPDTAPSDAIAYFSVRMERILASHTREIDDRQTWMRVVGIDSVASGTNGKITPKFHVLPQKSYPRDGGRGVPDIASSTNIYCQGNGGTVGP